MSKINTCTSLKPVNFVNNDELDATASYCCYTVCIRHWENRVVKCIIRPLGVTCVAAFAESSFKSVNNYTNEVTLIGPFTSSSFVQTIKVVLQKLDMLGAWSGRHKLWNLPFMFSRMKLTLCYKSWICWLREADDTNYGTYRLCSVGWSWHCATKAGYAGCVKRTTQIMEPTAYVQ